ncbi:MAG: acylphosphatase [Proteobacteria bacterium]|nr:acylphosphatase [Pseudomonadota bacterium]
MSSDPPLALHLQINGRVQGVGFRHALHSRAQASGAAGWVRNRLDGTVEAHLEGPASVVRALAKWARTGPPAARVTRVVIEEVPPGTASLSGFEARPTA